jgi:uncharacterized protein YjbI with pentapeptide repeats
MAREEQVEILKQGVTVWNKWRANNPYPQTDLREIDLSKANLTGINLSGAYLNGANLREADLSGANLIKADLRGADLRGAILDGTNLSGALLTIADLEKANLRLEDFSDATVTVGSSPNLTKSYPWGDEFIVEKLESNEMLDESEHDSLNTSRILRIKFPLPDLLPLEEYFNSVTERLHAVELLYIIFSMVYSKEYRELIKKILSPKGEYDEPHGYSLSHRYSTAKSIINNTGIESVRLVSVHYGSDASFDLLGIGKIVEILRDTLKDVAWRSKHEQQMAKLELENKEADIEHTRRESEKIAVETANQKIALLERVTSLDLDQDQKETVISALLPNLQLLTDKPVIPRLKSVSSVKKLTAGTKGHSLPKPKH